MQIINERKLDFDDVLIRPKRSEMASRSNVNLIRSFTTRHSEQTLECCPIVSANMDSVGTMAMAEVFSKHKMLVCLHKFYKVEELVDFYKNKPEVAKYCFYTMGITDDDFAKIVKVSEQVSIDKICIDVANGYSVYFCENVKRIRHIFPNAVMMVGNVATPEMVQELLILGNADIIKIGIGPGKVCTTRKVTGVGYPQLSAVIECADAAHGLGGLVCADGGCREPGDIAKAIGAGADFVMLGGMLAGHDECEGEWELPMIPEAKWFQGDLEVIEWKNKHKKFKFYGMSSREAMEKYAGGVASYRAAEGKCEFIDYKGPVDGTIQQILGGLRSTCSYVGATKIKDLSKCTTFVLTN